MSLFLIRVINMFLQVIIYLILGRAIMSWFIRPGDSLYAFYLSIIRITEPIIVPFRNIINRFMGNMGVDFSPLLAIFAISFVQRILNRLLIQLLF